MESFVIFTSQNYIPMARSGSELLSQKLNNAITRQKMITCKGFINSVLSKLYVVKHIHVIEFLPQQGCFRYRNVNKLYYGRVILMLNVKQL